MFEKEAEEYYKDVTVGTFQESVEDFEDAVLTAYKDGAEFGYNKANEWHFVKDGAEFGYNKANEWHFVKDGDYPKEKGNYLVAWKRTHYVEEYGEWGFDVDLFNADEGYFEGVGDYVIAWKEIVLPKEVKNA